MSNAIKEEAVRELVEAAEDLHQREGIALEILAAILHLVKAIRFLIRG